MVPLGHQSSDSLVGSFDLYGTRASCVHRRLSHDHRRVDASGQSAVQPLRRTANHKGDAMNADLGPLLYSYFEDYLKCQKGLRSSSVKSYRDSVTLFLLFLAEQTRHKVSRLTLADLT